MQVYFLQMTNTPPKVARTKDPIAIKIGKRIAQARKMAGFKSANDLRRRLPDWPENRLSWYEAGYSMPHPSDVERISKVTGTSPCWIFFGLGPIGSGERDLQAVRHQNLVYLHREAEEGADALLDRFLASLKLDPRQLTGYIDNPFLRIGERLARRIEKAAGRPRNWLDEQHVESDGLCGSFPDDLRELMTIYSEMDERNRDLLLSIARAVAEHR